MKTRTFSFSSDRLLGRVMTPVRLVNPFTNETMETIALWDTGAVNSVVSNVAAEYLQLKRMGKIVASGIFKSKRVSTYYALLRLSENVSIPILPAEFQEQPAPGVDCIIGMDVISKGDFTISNYKGRTRFCFRIPSGGDVDLTEEGMRQP